MTVTVSGDETQKPGEPPLLWIAGIVVTLAIAVYATIVSFQTGFDISDILFDIPVVLSCYAFLRRGFYLSLGITVLYIGIVIFHGPLTEDTLVHAGLTGLSFIIIAVIVTWLSEKLVNRSLLYEIIFENTGTGMIIVEEDLSVRFANRMIESTLGIPRSSIVGSKKILEHILPEDREILLRYHAARLDHDNGVPDSYEFRIRDSRGQVQNIFINAALIPGTKRVIASMLNITDKKQSDVRIRSSEENLRSILASMDDLIFSIDKEDRFSEYHQTTQDGLYIPPEEFIGKNYREVLPHHLVPLLSSVLLKVRETGTTQEVEYPLLITGNTRWFNARISPRYDSTGSYDGVTIVARDVTEIRKISQRNALLASIITSSDDAIIGQKTDGTIWSWNTSAEKMYGYTAEEMIGQNISRLVPPRIKPQIDEAYSRILDGGHVDQFDTARLKKDGSELEVSFTISPIKDESGTIIGITTMAHDLTRQREEERAILAFITEAAMRLNSPVEQIAVNLNQIRTQTEDPNPPIPEIALELEIQRKNALQVVENLRQLNRAITEKLKNLPEAYREYLNK